MATKNATGKTERGLERQSAESRPLNKINFIMMAASGLLIVAGFLLMLGSGNDGGEFNADIFSTRRVVIGPTMAFIGFIAMGVAIMWRGKK